jgi:tetratricopeptide (TPR) repeat protein
VPTHGWRKERIKVSRSAPDERLAKARESLSQADFTSAISFLEKLVGEDSGNSEAWRELGVCYLETRQPERALEALACAIHATPEDAAAHYLLGNACGSVGQLERAAGCYRRVLELDPRHVKAEEFLVKAESLLESREHYRRGLKWLYSPLPSAQNLNQALRELAQSIAVFQDSPARDNLLECARRLMAQKQEWIIHVNLAAETEPWVAACERGYHCVSFHNWVGARAAYDEALRHRSGDAFVHHALGFSLVELGELDDSVRAWLRTIELDPNYDFTRFGRLWRS